MREKEIFYDFMREYLEFFDTIIEAQKNQLSAVLSKDLKQVEKSAAMLQTLIMKLESMEKKRMLFQQNAGYGEMTFNKIIETTTGEEKQILKDLFEKIESKVSDVSYYSAKCKEKVQLDLTLWDSIKPNRSTNVNLGGYTAQKKQVNPSGGTALFETKA